MSDLWRCPECGVAVQELHTETCAVRNVKATPVWFGPPITPGMLPRVMADSDMTLKIMGPCMHCERPFEGGDVVFENRAQTVGIHGECILALAALVPRVHPNVAAVEEEFERRRAELDGR